MSLRSAVSEAPRVFAAIVALAAHVALPPATPAQTPVIFNRPLSLSDAAAVERAKAGAARKLQDAECLKVLADFKDLRGQPLTERLTQWGVSADEYLQMIPFLDGSSHEVCRRNKVYFAATPGTPRVLVCGQFNAAQRRDPWFAEALIIHEMLHTLGLGEDPPSSIEITRKVNDRCR